MARKASRSKSIASSAGVEEIEFETRSEVDAFYIDPEAEKKLVRKLDWKLIPWLCLLYLISFLDRTNIGNAKIQGPGSQPKLNNTVVI
jgi:hypothetical protein